MSASQGGVSYKKNPGDLCLGVRCSNGAGWVVTKGSLSVLLPSNSWRAGHPEPGSFQEASHRWGRARGKDRKPEV